MSLSTRLRDMPIKRKLKLISLLISGFALLAMSLITVVRGWIDWHERTLSEVGTYTNVIGINVVPALVFDDRELAEQMMRAALSENHNVVHAIIYDKYKKPFAAYKVSNHPSDELPYLAPGTSHFTFTELFISKPIELKKEMLGSIVVEVDMRGLFEAILFDTVLIFMTALGVFLGSVYSFSKLQREITDPILDLAKGMQTVSAEKNYAVRVSAYGKDEIGMLAHTFNDMLERIQLRDVELKRHQEHLEEEVAQRTAKLTEAQRIAHLGNWEWDIANNTLYWSDEIYRIFGLTPQQFGATYDAFLQVVHPVDRQSVDARVREALKQGNTYSIDHRILLPDGAVRYVHEQAEVFRNEDGRAIKMVGTVQDITVAKQAEEALSQSEAAIRAIVEHSPIAMIVDIGVDADEQVVMMNQRFTELFGYTMADIPNVRRWWQLAYPDERYRAELRAEWIGRVEKAIQSHGGIEPMEASVTCKDGSSRYVRVSLASIGSRNIVTFEDLTERKQVEEKIHKLNEELETKVQERTQQLLAAQEALVRKEKLAVLGQVAGSVGHELRNPLGVMNNAVYFLQTILSGADETTKEYLNIIKDEIAGSERIVSDLLDSVRTKPPRPEAVGVREMMEQTLSKCTVPPAVTVKLEIPETLPPLQVDAVQIQQVFRNLISNGVEAMPDGGPLEIRVVENSEDKTITISVRDSGIGMTPEVMGKLFQPLFTTKARGIGLGLVVVKNLTQANGGRVEVQSELGKGTTFTIVLPT